MSTTNILQPINVTNGTNNGVQFQKTSPAAWDGGFQSLFTLRNAGDFFEFTVPAIATVEMEIGLAFSNTPTFAIGEMGLQVWLKGQSNPGVGVWLQNGAGIGAVTGGFVAGDKFKFLLVGGNQVRIFKNGVAEFGGTAENFICWTGFVPLRVQVNVNNQNGIIPYASTSIFSLGINGLNYRLSGFGGLHSQPFAQHDNNFAAALIVDLDSNNQKEITDIVASSFTIPIITDTFARLLAFRNYNGDLVNDLFDPIFPGEEVGNVLAANDTLFQRGTVAQMAKYEKQDLILDAVLEGQRKDGRISWKHHFAGLKFGPSERITVILTPVIDLGDLANTTVGYTTDGAGGFIWNGFMRYVGWIEQAPNNVANTQPVLTVKSTARRSLSVFGKFC